MKTSKNLNKAVLILVIVSAFALQASAQDSYKLEKEFVELNPSQDHLHFNNSYLDKDIDWNTLLQPDQESLEPLQVQSTQNNPNSSQIDLNYSKNGSTHSTVINRANTNNTELNTLEKDRLFSTNHSGIQVQAYTHYHVIIVDYTLEDGTTLRNKYYGEEPEKIPFTSEITENVQEQTIEQTITKDNLHQEQETSRLSLLFDEEAQLNSINFQGADFEQCEDNYYMRDDKEALQNSGVDSDLIVPSDHGYEYRCYNLTIPENSAPQFEISYTYPDTFREEGDDFIVEDRQNFNAYIIGSAGATRINGGYSLCGTLDGYDNIIIEGYMTLDCSSTIQAENLIEIRSGGDIDGSGEDGEDGESTGQAFDADGHDGTAGNSITLNAPNINIHGDIDTSGGNGGDGQGSGDDDAGIGGQGANAGSITVNADNHLSVTGNLIANGGDGGNAENECESYPGGISCDVEPGGDAGDAGQITFSSPATAKFENSNINMIGGEGGDGANGYEFSGDDGGNAGNSKDFSIEAYEMTIDSTSVNTYPLESGRGGAVEFTTPGQPGTPGNQYYKASKLNITNSNFIANGGDANNGDGADGYDGTPGATITIEGHERNLKNNQISAEGGEGSKAYEECDDNFYRAFDGGNGGQILGNFYSYEVMDNIFNVEGGDGGDADGCNDNDGDGGNGGDGGLINLTYRDSINEAFNDFRIDGGRAGDETGDGEEGLKGEIGQTNITQDTNLDITTIGSDSDVQIENINITSVNGEQEYRIDQRNDVKMSLEFVSNEELSTIPTTSWFNEDDNTIVNSTQMNLQSTENVNGEYHYLYTYTHDITQDRESAGKWLTDVQIEDNYGNTYTDTAEFIYQNADLSRGNPIQRQAVFGQTIPYDQRATVENPSSTSFSNVNVRFKLFEGVTYNFFEITRESNDEVIDYRVDEENGYLYWNTSVGAGGSIDYNIQYDLQPVQVEEELEYEEQDGRVTAFQKLTVESPSPNITIQDIDAQWDFAEPQRVVDWKLYFFDEEITFNENFDPFTTDSDNTGFQNQLNWNIDALNPDNPPQEYTIRTDLGEPIIKYRENVITNRPVEEGKPIRWRVGFAFENNNNFVVPYSDRLRVPLDASNIRLDGQLQDSRFDTQGTYAIFEDTLNANSNSTAFLRYETRSISSTQTTDRPKNHTVDEPSVVRHSISMENLANQQLKNITDSISLDYGENLKLIDEDEEQVLDEQDIVQDEYQINIDKMNPDETKNLQVAYEIPTATSTHIRDGQTDNGNNLAVWEIQNDNQGLLQNVEFVTEEIDCIEVEEIRVIQETNSTGTNTIENYECGSTIVPLGDLQPEETMRIGIAYSGEQVQFSDDTNGGVNVLFGVGKWLVIAGLFIGLAELGRRWWYR